MTRDVTADDKLLAQIDAVLGPQSSAKTRLVEAVGSFGDDAFQSMRSNEAQHLSCRLVRFLRKCDVISSLDHFPENGSAGGERVTRKVSAFVNQDVECIVDDVSL
jgi:hypothetical protein